MRRNWYRGTARGGWLMMVGAVAMVVLAMIGGIVAGCSQSKTGTPAPKKVIRLGFFPNFTHAAPIVGLKKGFFQEALGPNVEIKQNTFVAGPELMTALLAGQLDVVYVGPGPALTAYSKARNLKIVAGSNNAGATLVARKSAGITNVAGLRGKKVAVPQLGNTQDISLRHLLTEAGLKPADKGGDVEIIAIAPADLQLTFQRKEVDAALVPEPWGTILTTKGAASLVLDARQVWENGNYPTTVLVATDEFAKREPALLDKWLSAHRRTVAFLKESPDESAKILGGELKRLTGKEIPADVLSPAFARNIPTDTIDRKVFADFIKVSREAGFLKTSVTADEILSPNLK